MKNVAIRLVANMIALHTARRDTPITKVNDWSVTIISSRIFTDDLKEDLSAFVREKSNKSDTIEFFAITGDKLW